MRSNEVVLITEQEAKYLDASIERGGLGLKSKLPEDGSDRLEFAGIVIAPQTIENYL